MRALSFYVFLLATLHFCNAETLEFDLSPPGSGGLPGLNAANEVIPGESLGSGGETGTGILFDNVTKLLTLNLAYGSAYGFTDLTSPAFSWLMHGPSPESETAPVLFNLESFHSFAADPAQGGQIAGALALTADQEASLLSGLTYINIYTPTHLGGEIRGQLVLVPEPQSWLLLAGALSAFAVFKLRRRRGFSSRCSS